MVSNPFKEAINRKSAKTKSNSSPNQPSQPPIVAVTGTNGKTTTVRVIAYLAHLAGFYVGFTTTDGIYINNELILAGDCSGPISAKCVLQDPNVNFVVLECARGGIIREGLGFESCDVSIILNVTGDHIGADGIETMEQLAQVKSIVATSTKEHGFCILNADDNLVYEMRKFVSSNIALFSLSSSNKRIIEHYKKGGTVIYLNQNEIILQTGFKKIKFGNINTFPLTFHGAAKCMFANILVTLLAAYLNGFNIKNLTTQLKKFLPTPENLPGRMNLFDFGKFKVLLDYGHNVGAYQQMQLFLGNINATKIVGIIAVPSDRKIEDFKMIGSYAAKMFDEVIIRYEKDPRRRTNEEVTSWIQKGINDENLDKILTIIPDELEALKHAVKNAVLNSYIVYFPTDISSAINFLKNFKIYPQ